MPTACKDAEGSTEYTSIVMDGPHHCTLSYKPILSENTLVSLSPLLHALFTKKADFI